MPRNSSRSRNSQPSNGKLVEITVVRLQDSLLITGALQSAIFNSANFSSIATDAKGVMQRPLVECGES
jgi:hypothetical protein